MKLYSVFGYSSTPSAIFTSLEQAKNYCRLHNVKKEDGIEDGAYMYRIACQNTTDSVLAAPRNLFGYHVVLVKNDNTFLVSSRSIAVVWKDQDTVTLSKEMLDREDPIFSVPRLEMMVLADCAETAVQKANQVKTEMQVLWSTQDLWKNRSSVKVASPLLKQLNHTKKKLLVDETKQLMGKQELADKFGVTRSTINKWLAQGLFPKPMQMGRLHVWRRKDIKKSVAWKTKRKK